MSSIVIAIGAVLAIWLVAAWAVSSGRREQDEQAWEQYLQENEGVAKFLGDLARPLSRSKAVGYVAETPSYRRLRDRLILGDTFAGSVEVLVSIQALCLLVGASGLILAIGGIVEGVLRLVLAGASALLPAWPLSHVNDKARKRAAAITKELPEFADLLIMALPGMSVISAVGFTSEQASGVVASEMRELVRSLQGRNMNQADAFAVTALRLGTQEGKEFVGVLQNAYIEGTKVIETISAQAENMRKIAYQQQREVVKKMPVKLVIMFAIHFMPLLFAVALIPVAAGLRSV